MANEIRYIFLIIPQIKFVQTVAKLKVYVEDYEA